MMRNINFFRARSIGAGFLLLATVVVAGAASPKLPVVPKWQRFEQSFKSVFLYTNALQEAWMSVVFTSPTGQKYEVDGFWDGGRTWRVRFSPDELGRWKYQTACSDETNPGLHKRGGEFLCASPVGETRFHKHGPVRVARDRRHLEHLDGTPFFWVADTVWNGARMSDPKEWGYYAGCRASQRFSVAQWAVAPGMDVKNQSAYAAFPDQIGINPEFFQRLDAKQLILSQAGILSAICPLLELPSQKNVAPPLPDAQAELIFRYVVARYGADPVVWLLAFEADGAAANVGRWKRIGQTVLGSRAHAPVLLFTGETQWVLDEFRDLNWVDLFGYQAVTGFSEDALKWTFTGPFGGEWKKQPARPIIGFAPYENGVIGRSQKRFSSEDVRHALYWMTLLTPPAGFSYGAQGVVDWDQTFGPQASENKEGDLPMWRKSLFLPVARQVGYLAGFMNSTDFWSLRPQPQVLAAQPGDQAPKRFIVAAANESNTLSLIYVPEDRALDVMLDTLPKSPSVGWLNPRTGERKPAIAVVTGKSCQFPTPDPGDWLLITKAGK